MNTHTSFRLGTWFDWALSKYHADILRFSLPTLSPIAKNQAACAATARRDIDTVQLALQHGFDVSWDDDRCIQKAAECGSATFITLLITAGAYVRTRSDAPVRLAAKAGHLESSETTTSSWRFHPRSDGSRRAAWPRSTSCVTDPIRRRPNHGMLISVQQNHISVARLLLTHGAHPNIGFEPAIGNGNYELVLGGDGGAQPYMS